jgi:hypothetical protein
MGGEAPNAGPAPHVPNKATWEQINQANQAAAAEKADRAYGAPITFYGEVIVSWESAEPIRLIRRNDLRPEFQERYVIRVTGLPGPVLNRLEASEIRSASLGVAGNRRVGADLAQVKLPVGYIEFAFPSRALPLSVADRSVRFIMGLGQMTVQVRFDLPRMTFRNALAL